MRDQLDALFARNRRAEMEDRRPVTITIADLREDIARGQSVARYTLQGMVGGAWRTLSQGTTIGYRKLERFEPITVSAIRVDVGESMGDAGPVEVALY
jgi:alpha-L-fucosidase